MIKVYVLLILVVVALVALPAARRAIGDALGGLRGLGDSAARRQLAEQAREQASRAAESARTAAGTARGAAGTAAGVARGTADAVRGAGESVSQSLNDRRLRTLGRTLTIEGDPASVKPALAAAVDDVAVLDPVDAGPGEAFAWRHFGTGDTRFAARPGPATVPITVFGVVQFEYALGEPQGVSVAGHLLDRATRRLDEAGIRWTEAVYTFVPGPQDSSEGMRRLA